MCDQYYKKLIPTVYELLNKAQMKKEDINRVIITSDTYTLKVGELFSDEFYGILEPDLRKQPTETIAKGAALLAKKLNDGALSKEQVELFNVPAESILITFESSAVSGGL